ncbi:protein obstructor-E-like [Achroia grisella]|uniref:protein obstructor-E-like n=1 Tax=Achroia grisella TaxID=688607 RepID=UPI0027D259D6|nr:protein obstructor-E-like [Achroia grisella]
MAFNFIATFTILFIARCSAQSEGLEERSVLCKSRNAYYGLEGSCDTYLECINYVANKMTCPDGLHYIPDTVWPGYPCAYPSDMTCDGRSITEPAKPTVECPHQYGYFPSPKATPTDCGHYYMCTEGRARDMMCPSGLAFSPDSGRCEWPENVPFCDAGRFLGFTCPPTPAGADPNDVFNYKFPGNCFAFYSCVKGHARLLTCDAGMGFNEHTGRCEDADKLNCPY